MAAGALWPPKIVAREEWLSARKARFTEEKEQTGNDVVPASTYVNRMLPYPKFNRRVHVQQVSVIPWRSCSASNADG